jgi:hypothetical protein
MDLGSGIRDPEKTYSGSRIEGQKITDPGSRIRDPDPQHCSAENYFLNNHRYALPKTDLDAI